MCSLCTYNLSCLHTAIPAPSFCCFQHFYVRIPTYLPIVFVLCGSSCTIQCTHNHIDASKMNYVPASVWSTLIIAWVSVECIEFVYSYFQYHCMWHKGYVISSAFDLKMLLIAACLCTFCSTKSEDIVDLYSVCIPCLACTLPFGKCVLLYL